MDRPTGFRKVPINAQERIPMFARPPKATHFVIWPVISWENSCCYHWYTRSRIESSQGQHVGYFLFLPLRPQWNCEFIRLLGGLRSATAQSGHQLTYWRITQTQFGMDGDCRTRLRGENTLWRTHQRGDAQLAAILPLRVSPARPSVHLGRTGRATSFYGGEQ